MTLKPSYQRGVNNATYTTYMNKLILFCSRSDKERWERNTNKVDEGGNRECVRMSFVMESPQQQQQQK